MKQMQVQITGSVRQALEKENTGDDLDKTGKTQDEALVLAQTETELPDTASLLKWVDCWLAAAGCDTLAVFLPRWA